MGHAHPARRHTVKTNPFTNRSVASRLVVQALLTARDAGIDTYAASIARSLGLSRAGVRGILNRLDTAGWVESHESNHPGAGAAAIKYYRLTADGASAAKAWLDERER
jgi:predicted ArsR family transcriptional regulator